MVDAGPSLQKFVQQSLSKGMPRQDLQETLLKAGWPKELIAKHLQKDLFVPATPSGKAILQVRGLSKAFDGRRVLDNVSLELKEGEIFGIIGASGTGKTTLLNCIVGFLQPDVGDVSFQFPSGPRSVRRDSEAIKSALGFSTQLPSFYSHLTVEENLVHFALLYGKSETKARANAVALAKLVGLQDSRQMLGRDLSGGMQKRLDIACALVHDPTLLILDEPVADLDVMLRSQLWDMLRSINKQGTTILIASHFLTELEQVCDRIGIMRDSRIAEVGTPDELRVIYSRNHEVRVELASHSYDALIASIMKMPALHVAKTTKEAGVLKIQTSQPTAAIDAVLQHARQRKDEIIHLDMGRPTIRELFEALLT